MTFDYTLQMSPLFQNFPKEEAPLRIDTAFRYTPATVTGPEQYANLTCAVAELNSADVRTWNAAQVAAWMYSAGFEDPIIEKFVEHDITGNVLLDLQFEDLKEIEIQSFGKRHQLWNRIDALRGGDGRISPSRTPFEDIDRPATRNTRSKSVSHRDRSQSRARRSPQEPEAVDDAGFTPITPGGSKKRRGRKNRAHHDDTVTPMESVSIVAIEQLMPKPHKCAKGERCPKWRKQQKLITRIKEENGFPISPEKGGHIYVAGDPGNPKTAPPIVDHVVRPSSDPNVPSLVASSDLLGASQLPGFKLEEGTLAKLEARDAQENVRHFLQLQGIDRPRFTPTPEAVYQPPTPPLELFPPLQPPGHTPAPHMGLKSLPKLNIPTSVASNPGSIKVDSITGEPVTSIYSGPRSASAGPLTSIQSGPRSASAGPMTILHANIPRSASAGPRSAGPRSARYTTLAEQAFANNSIPPVPPPPAPADLYRYGTPASEMDVPVTAIPSGPVSRETSQSVPPNMQFRDPVARTGSRMDYRRPSFALPVLGEDEVFSPNGDDSNSPISDTETLREGNHPGAVDRHGRPRSKSHSKKLSNASTITATKAPRGFQYDNVNHAGWMKKRKTKFLKHDWQDHHFRLTGTQLAMHPNELPSSKALDTIDVDEYAVACSSLASNKLSAKLKALRIIEAQNKATASSDPHAFAFQLVPTTTSKDGEKIEVSVIKRTMANQKTHHFAVKTRDDRIDWMREVMLAKALKAKGEGYEVNVNGAQM